MAADAEVDLEQLIDQRPLSVLQGWSIGLCATVALLDGYNTQSIGITAPAMARSFGVTMGVFAPVFSAALFGAMIGALALGALADRLGRKRVLVLATLVFAVFTAATAQSHSLTELMVFRFIAGLGLGGATPSFIALTTEYAPARLRGRLVSAMWAAFPLGGVLGGLVNPTLLADFGWRSVFYIGGAVPALVAILLAVALPESLRFLIVSGAAPERIARIVGRIAPDLPSDSRLTVQTVRASKAWFRNPFAGLKPAPTVLLWTVFFCTFMLLVFVPLWAVSLMAKPGGLSPAGAALIVALNNLGSVIGTAGLGRALDRKDPSRVLVGVYIVAALTIAGLGFVGASLPMGVGFGLVSGCMLGAGSAGAITLAASLYPTMVRSTGIGWAMAMGRLGQVVGPLVAGALLSHGVGASGIFPAVGAFALLAAASVLALALMARREG